MRPVNFGVLVLLAVVLMPSVLPARAAGGVALVVGNSAYAANRAAAEQGRRLRKRGPVSAVAICMPWPRSSRMSTHEPTGTVLAIALSVAVFTSALTATQNDQPITPLSEDDYIRHRREGTLPAPRDLQEFSRQLQLRVQLEGSGVATLFMWVYGPQFGLNPFEPLSPRAQEFSSHDDSASHQAGSAPLSIRDWQRRQEAGTLLPPRTLHEFWRQLELTASLASYPAAVLFMDVYGPQFGVNPIPLWLRPTIFGP